MNGEPGGFFGFDGKTAVIAAALREASSSVETTGPAKWRCMVSNGVDLDVVARASSEWLSMAACLSPDLTVKIDPWSLLQENFRLVGSAKFTISPHVPGLFVRAELPLDSGVELGLRVHQACRGFKQATEAFALLTKTGKPRVFDNVGEKGTGTEDSCIDLRPLCEASGWAVTERAHGTLAVNLDVADAVQEALVEVSCGGETRVTAELPGEGTPLPRCRAALGILLLRASGVLRMARAAAGVTTAARRSGLQLQSLTSSDSDAPCIDGGDDPTTSPLFEVVFGDTPASEELSHAFAALSLACGMYAREAEVLQRYEHIAAAYLNAWPKARAWTSSNGTQPHQRTT